MYAYWEQIGNKNQHPVLKKRTVLWNSVIYRLEGHNVNEKRTLGVLSIVTALISGLFFFIIRGPHVNLALVITVLTVLSLLGIFFAIISKNCWFMIIGIILNGAVLVVAYFLLLAMGISEP